MCDFWTSGKQASCTCEWSVIKSSTRLEQHTVLYLPTVCCLHIYLCFQFPVLMLPTRQCMRMGRSNPSIQSILAIKRYLTSMHCLLRAMYTQRRGKRMGGKKEGSKWYGNILGRNWDIFFSQDSVSLMLLLLKDTAQSYPTSDDSLRSALPAPCNGAKWLFSSHPLSSPSFLQIGVCCGLGNTPVQQWCSGKKSSSQYASAPKTLTDVVIRWSMLNSHYKNQWKLSLESG